MAKTHKERVLGAVGRRPKSRDQVAAKLGVSPQAVSRTLGDLRQEGKIVRTDKGFQKA
jgi:predicted transcriptional regulator